MIYLLDQAIIIIYKQYQFIVLMIMMFLFLKKREVLVLECPFLADCQTMFRTLRLIVMVSLMHMQLLRQGHMCNRSYILRRFLSILENVICGFCLSINGFQSFICFRSIFFIYLVNLTMQQIALILMVLIVMNY